MKRPLFWTGITFLFITAVFFKCHSIYFDVFRPLAIGFVALAAVAALLLHRMRRAPTRGQSIRRLCGALALLCCAAAFGAAYATLRAELRRQWLAPYQDPAAPVTLTITVRTAQQYGATVLLCKGPALLQSGQEAGRRTSEVSLLLYNAADIAARPGEVLRCTAKPLAPDVRSGTPRFALQTLLADRLPSPHPFALALVRLRLAISARLHALCGGARLGGLLPAMLIGDREALPVQVQNDWRAAGLSHLLVVSGLHLVLFAQPVLLLCGRMRPKWGAVCALLCFWGFALLCGMGIAVVRAAMMLSLTQTATLVGRRGDTLTSLAAAGVLIALLNPAAVAGASFLMSFGAVLGLALLQPLLLRALQSRLPARVAAVNWLCNAVSVSVAAQVGVLPALLYYFGAVALLGSVANLAATLLVPLILPMGAAALLLSLVPGLFGVARLLMLPVLGLLRMLCAVAAFTGGLPFAQVGIGARWQAVLLLSAALLLLWIGLRTPRAFGARAALLALAARGMMAVGLTVAVLFTALGLGQPDYLCFEGGVLCTVGRRAVLVGAPADARALSSLQTAMHRTGALRLEAVLLTDDAVLGPALAALLQAHPEAALCCANTPPAFAFAAPSARPRYPLPDEQTSLCAGVTPAELYRLYIMAQGDDFFADPLNNSQTCAILNYYEPHPTQLGENTLRLRKKAGTSPADERRRP